MGEPPHVRRSPQPERDDKRPYLKRLADTAEGRVRPVRRTFGDDRPSGSGACDPARQVAFEVLQAVTCNDAYANLLLPSTIRRHRLSPRDSKLATEMVYGTLRAQGTYDAIIAACASRPLEQLDSAVVDLLRLGAHQLLALRIPAHAAVYQMVGLTHAVAGPKPATFVNAVLRAISQKTRHEWISELTAELEDPVAIAALRYWHPEWIVRAFRQALVGHGRPVGEIDTLLSANNTPAPVHVAALPGLGSVDGSDTVEASSLLRGAAISRGGDPSRIPGMREGHVRVQDIGSQLVARALTAAPLSPEEPRGERGGETWLDLCAGPGGKAALLAALAAEQSATLLANDSAPHRVALVREALAPLPKQVWSVRTGDGRDLEPMQTFDRVLVDAPCTGLGALRRRPESRWRRQPGDVATLSQLQRELLESAYRALAPGGVLAYVTCSPHIAETTAVVGDTLARHQSAQLLDTGAILDSVAATPLEAGQPWQPTGRARRQQKQAGTGQASLGTTAQLWPHIHHTDAMFLALIRKSRDPARVSTPRIDRSD